MLLLAKLPSLRQAQDRDYAVGVLAKSRLKTSEVWIALYRLALHLRRPEEGSNAGFESVPLWLPQYHPR